MGKCEVAAGVLTAVLAASSVARAQDAAGEGRPARHYKTPPLNLHREALGSAGHAAAARARMRNGDCEGALEEFDAAIYVSIDASLRRDRGLCHERLGDAYPAIDDYRYYLTMEPDAPDADGIRERLARLEQDNLGHSSASTDTPDATPGPSTANGAAPTAPPAAPASSPPADDDEPPRRDAMETVEHDRDDIVSPLRRGTGWSVAPFFAEHKWWFSGTSFGEGDTWSECIGLQLRWSVTRAGAFVLEGGYEQFNSGAANISGLTSQLGYEIRFKLDPAWDNQLLVVPGIGYQYLTYAPALAGAQSTAGGAFVPRIRFAYRRMLAASTALDLALDGGVTAGALAQGTFLTNTTSPTAVLVAFNLSVAWGL